MSLPIMKMIETEATKHKRGAALNSSLVTKLKVAPFVALALMHKIIAAAADTIYATENNSNTQYSINYDANVFSNMISYVRSYTDSLIAYSSSAVFKAAGSLACTNPNTGAEEYSVTLGVEVGKSLTNTFLQNFNNAMLQMCNEFYGTADNTPSGGHLSATAIGIISALGFVALCACALVFCCCRSMSNSLSSDRSYVPLVGGPGFIPPSTSIDIGETWRPVSHHPHHSSVIFHPTAPQASVSTDEGRPHHSSVIFRPPT